MLEIEWTPIRIVPVINSPFRMVSIFLVAVLSIIIIINAE